MKSKSEFVYTSKDDGSRAFVCGSRLDDNPYIPGTDAYCEWKQGWISARDAHRRYVIGGCEL